MSLRLSRRQLLAGSASLFGASLISPAWSTTAPTILPIPPLADGTNEEPVDLKIRAGEHTFPAGVKTPTLGINQNFLGPTLRTRRNTELNLSYMNTLDEGVSIHGHGLHVPGDVDGGPQLEMAPGEGWQPSLSIVQPAATCWYHSHTHGKTGDQVYRGLAGMIIIDDDESDALDLPNRYGVDDLPIIIQDRTFDGEGRFVYSLYDADEDGWFGDTVVINGAIGPLVADVPAGKVGLRLLNGANARFYVIAFSDNRVFHKIATDGGLLPTPVPMTTMEMSPGERCEIVVDLADANPVEFLTFFEDEIDDEGAGIVGGLSTLVGGSDAAPPRASLTLRPDARLVANKAPLPDKLAHIRHPEEHEIKNVREFVLEMDHSGDHVGHDGHGKMDMTINGAVMDMSVINERVGLGVWERWRIRSDQGAHPFHIHGCSFLIEQMEGEAVPADQLGWKDTVVLDDDDWSEIVVRFDHIATEQYPYMYHCHILEHEDRGMMGQFTVT
ncbi:multicopper oxidase domain-containing protein [Roseibium sp. MB-4]